MTTLPMLLSTNKIRANIETCGSWLERIFRNAFHIIISIDRQVHCFKCTYIHSFTHSFIHLFIHSFIYCVFIHSFVYVSFYLLIDFSIILPTPSHLVLCSINSLNSIINKEIHIIIVMPEIVIKYLKRNLATCNSTHK